MDFGVRKKDVGVRGECGFRIGVYLGAKKRSELRFFWRRVVWVPYKLFAC